MSSEKQVVQPDLTEFNSLLGPPPVWSTESLDNYQKVLENLLACLDARDFLEKMLIRDAAVATWEIIRMGRQKGLAVERKFRDRLHFQARRAQEHKQRKETLERTLAGQNGKASSPAQRAVDLVEFLDESDADIVAILQRAPTELDHAKAFEEAFEHYDRLDRKIDQLIKRRNDSLDQLENYRAGLGQAARLATNQIIDAEFSEACPEVIAEAPPLVPAEAEGQTVIPEPVVKAATENGGATDPAATPEGPLAPSTGGETQ